MNLKHIKCPNEFFKMNLIDFNTFFYNYLLENIYFN